MATTLTQHVHSWRNRYQPSKSGKTGILVRRCKHCKDEEWAVVGTWTPTRNKK